MPGKQDYSDQEPQFKPLTKEEAAALRAKQHFISPWRVIFAQIALGTLLTLAAWVLFPARVGIALSVGYGALTVILPAALLARGLMSPVTKIHVGVAVFGFFFWELVKIVSSVAMLMVAPKLIEDLSWPGLLIGLVVTMKVYLGAAFLQPEQNAK